MSSVMLRGVTKTYGGKGAVPAVDQLDLEIADGEFMVLLGASGCGKTTTLRSIAGLEQPEAGSIQIGDKVVFDQDRDVAVAPNKRDIGMVFQSYALWPHKTVRGNIGYPLKARGKRDKIAEWVPEVAALVSCGHLLERLPSQLSGGQQQRVALARGLVARPHVVLFDEPLSNLDARLRDQVRGELHNLHRKVGFSGLYVTHDQSEALALGDRLAVMRDGRIEQLGSPREVFELPATEYVADFVGFFNRLRLERGASGWTSPSGALTGDVPETNDDVDVLTLRVRPEDLSVVSPDETPPTGFALRGAVVVDRFYAGRTVEVTLGAGGSDLRASVPHRLDDGRLLEPGAPVTIGIDRSACVAYSVDGAHLVPSWSTGARSRASSGVR